MLSAKLSRMKKRWDRLTGGWAGTFIYITLGFAIAYGINAALGIAFNTATPVVAVFSDSMVPTLLRGDMVFVYGDRDVAVGDIIVFDVPGYRYPIIHRVHSISDGLIRTKGDHNQYVDSWTTTAAIIHGKAGLRVPLLGWVKIGFVTAVSAFR